VLVVEATWLHEKTKRLYDSLGSADFTSGSRTYRAAEDLRQGHPVDFWQLASGFQRVSLVRFPAVKDVFNAVSAAGGTPLLCGAGPTVMSLHHDLASANLVASALRVNGSDIRVVPSVPPTNWLDS
ncbi:MAG TPA: hypothetical protein VKT80_10125, partial [Chloroflexota bacterium]|nr:hypothetical protein [Chloroflexota bacterium]